MKKLIVLVLLINLSLQTSLSSRINAVMTQMDKMALKNDFSK